MYTRHRTIIVFGFVGILNTLTDLVIYTALHIGGAPIVLANICSTSAALLLSYFLHKKFTFRSKRRHQESLPLFIGVTLTGLWVLQPAIIYLVVWILSLSPFAGTLAHIPEPGNTAAAVIGKLAATGASMVWNYVLYNKIVFHHPEQPKQEAPTSASEAETT